MGQQESSDNASSQTVICCTTRGDDEARPGESIIYASCEATRKDSGYVSPSRSLVKKGEGFDDGGTGGTGTAQRARNESGFCDAGNGGFSDLGAFACLPTAADSTVGREALFGHKAVKTKLVRLRNYEAEVESLMQIRTQISKRLPDDAEGKPLSVPAPIDAGGVSRIPEAELVRRLRLHEESLAGVPEKFVTQACGRVLSLNAGLKVVGGAADSSLVDRLVDLKDMKNHYAEILTAVDNLVQERISHLHTELTKLDAEVGEIEDLIALCFDKMDEEATGSITSVAFVDFVCEQETHEVEQEGSVARMVSCEDAESLFIQMSHGQGEITFDQFKDEITAGCLQVMSDNLMLRRHIQKRYRDYWF